MFSIMKRASFLSWNQVLRTVTDIQSMTQHLAQYVTWQCMQHDTVIAKQSMDTHSSLYDWDVRMQWLHEKYSHIFNTYIHSSIGTEYDESHLCPSKASIDGTLWHVIRWGRMQGRGSVISRRILDWRTCYDAGTYIGLFLINSQSNSWLICCH